MVDIIDDDATGTLTGEGEGGGGGMPLLLLLWELDGVIGEAKNRCGGFSDVEVKGIGDGSADDPED